jgi:predicted enzyme related to lactoylglutathione lyase
MLTKPSEICLVFHCADLDRTERFYREAFSFSFERRGSGDTRMLFLRLSSDFSMSFMRGCCEPGNSPLVTFTLPDGGIADVVAGLANMGATIVSPVGDAPYGQGAAFLDPDSHAMGLYQPAGKPLSLKEPAP